MGKEGWGEQQVPEQDHIKGCLEVVGGREGSVTRLRSKVSAWPSSQADLQKRALLPPGPGHHEDWSQPRLCLVPLILGLLCGGK